MQCPALRMTIPRCLRVRVGRCSQAMSLLFHVLVNVAFCLGTGAAIGGEAAALPTVGELWMGTPETAAIYRDAFHAGLRELGYRDGANVKLVTRYALGDLRRIPTMVDELVAERVDVVYLIPAAIRYARQRAPTIPIVSNVDDPVAEGFAASLARPGGNVTGLAWQSPESVGKRIELANELVPGLKRVTMIFADSDVMEANLVDQAMQHLGVHVQSLRCAIQVLSRMLSATLKERPQFIMVLVSALTITHRQRLASFAINARIPLISEGRDWAAAGALVAYGPNPLDMMRRTATYVDRILRGAKAAELPFGQPDKFELVVNRTTADAIGVRIPESILLRADLVIR